MLGGVADDRDDDHADEELGEPDRLEASLIEPTSTSDITPTSTPAIASAITEVRVDQPQLSSSPYSGLKMSRWVFSEKKRPTT